MLRAVVVWIAKSSSKYLFALLGEEVGQLMRCPLTEEVSYREVRQRLEGSAICGLQRVTRHRSCGTRKPIERKNRTRN